MYGSYDIKLVALSLIVATMAAYTALDMSGRITQADSRRKSMAWLIAGALAMGSGIWSMHFVGMLAYQLPIAMRYDPLITLVSLLFAVLLSGLALWLVSREQLTWRSIAGGGVAMAAGICGMHYTGMEAMKMQPPIQYDPLLFGLSVAIALGASMAALYLCFRLRRANDTKGLIYRLGAAVIMGSAVAGMHYTGMAAANIPAGAICGAGNVGGFFALDTQAMGIGIAIVIAQLMLASMVASAVQTAKANELERANQALSEARDAAEEAAKSKAAFLATMSHEIRTPMNAVVGFAGLLSDTKLDSGQKDFVDSIRKSGDHLLSVINDVLDFSKMASGKLELERAPLELRSVIETAFDFVSSLAHSKGLKLSYTVADNVPKGLEADELRLRQVLINLLSNAVKFTQNGHVMVTVDAERQAGGEYLFQFSVKDTGIGITAEQLPKLFNEFKQADASTTRLYGGSGLGLAICNALVTLHGGRIWAESQAKIGSIFYFTLPAHACEVEQATSPAQSNRFLEENGASQQRQRSNVAIPPQQAAANDTQRFEPLSLLLAEDNLMNQRVAAMTLQRFGLECDVVDNGQEALLAAKQKAYDAILMDVQMPILDGLQATRAIRELGDSVHQPFIIALTANAMHGDREMCMEAGMDGYIPKPIDRNDLIAELKKVRLAKES